MAAAAKPTKGLISVRSNDLFISPPGIMGFERLITPDEFRDQSTGAISKNFQVQVHYNDEQREALAHRIQLQVIDRLWDKFLAEAAEKKMAEPRGGWQKPDGAVWLDDHLIDPPERSKTQLPFVKWKNAAEYRDKKSGEMKLKEMRAYDAKNNLLSLRDLKLGMGSTIQPVLIGGIYKSPLIKQPDLSFKLQGVRVLKLIQYGGGPKGLHEVSDDDLAGLDKEDLDLDLGAYAKGDKDPPRTAREEEPSEDAGFDEDELPF